MKSILKLRYIVLAAGIASAAMPLSADLLQDFEATPEKAAGIYYAYPTDRDSLPPVPEGFRPVYLSHYGRHGSRWVIKESIYKDAVAELERQKAAGNTTLLADSLLSSLRRCGEHAQGHFGELSPLGQRQHRAIASRMMQRFPELFESGDRINACSSTTPRCIVSMAAFLNELTRRNPELDITFRSTPGEMDVIALDWAKKDHAFEREFKSEAFMRRYKTLRDSLTESRTTAARIFKNPGKVEDLPEFMRNVYDAAIDVQDVVGLDEDILSVFTPADLFDQWQSFNYRMFMQNANENEFSYGYGPKDAEPLLALITEDARRALKEGNVSVDLRFGHDTALVRLLALMGAENCSGSTSDLTEANKIWHSQEISPMAANLQLIFFANDKGEIIFLPRLNEQPLKLKNRPSLPGHPNYYQWQ